MTPFVSCVCPTFGRAPTYLHLLQEAVYWFTRQDYPDKELILYNDCPQQRLICHVPQVRVINHSERHQTLGEKYNAMVAEAKGEIILPWEDDDISLPGRITQAVQKLSSTPEGRGYFNPQMSWFEDSGILHLNHKHGVCHNSSAYHKQLLLDVGGYPHTLDQDMRVDTLLKHNGVVAERLYEPREWTYIYRWGVSSSHLSGDPNSKDTWERVAREVTPGTVFVLPVALREYASETLSIISPRQCSRRCMDTGRCDGSCKVRR